MVESISFQEMGPGEEKELTGLVASVFMEFVAPGYSPEGVGEFMGFVTPEKIQERVRKSESFVLTAKTGKALVGIVEIKNQDHIALLFVAKKYHGRGIAKKLFELSLSRSRKINQELKEITVNSSPYAVTIYQKLGFKLAGHEQVKNGIRFIPLIYTIAA